MKVTLYKPHTHAGKRYEPGPEGEQVDLPPDAVAWLRAHTDVLNNPKASADAPTFDPKPTRADADPVG